MKFEGITYFSFVYNGEVGGRTLMKINAQPFDTMQYFYSDIQPPLIRCCIRFNGKIDKERLMIALNRVLKAYPILRCKYIANKREWAEAEFCDNDYLTILTPDSEQETVEMEKLMSSLLIGIDPPMRIFLICGEEKDTICVVVSHLICDGRGFEQLIYRISKYYSFDDTARELACYEDICKRRDFCQITKNFSFFEKIKILCSKSVFSSNVTQKAIPLVGKNSNPTILTRTITPDMFYKLHSFAKKHSSSMNDVFLTAYVHALHKQFGWNDITIPSPVDLRRFGGEKTKESVCNLTANYYCKVHIEKNETYEATLKKISSQMSKQKAESNCLKGPILFHLLYRIIHYSILKKIFFKLSPVPVTSYTNLGKIEETKLNFTRIEIAEAFFATAIKPVPYFQLTVSTFRNQCTLSSCTYAGNRDLSIISDLMDRIYEQIEKIASIRG
jgi:Uncharacterized protein containing a NRPS condensation (elongation) domain